MSSWIKLTAFKIGLWPILNYINTKGKGYGFSETDGCIYSFSVFDVLDVVYEWGSKVFVIPVGKKGKQSLFNPMRVEFPAACSVINKVWVLIPRQLAAG